MTTHFYRLMTLALGAFLALFGFGCNPAHTDYGIEYTDYNTIDSDATDKDQDPDMADKDWDQEAEEYACPYATFHIEGIVSDTGGNPIRAILISTNFGEGPEVTKTNNDGSFLLERTIFCNFNYEGNITISFSDIDENLSGGLFIGKTLDYQLERIDNDGTWDYGTYEKNDIYVTLERVGESDNDTLLEDEDGFTYPDDDTIYETDDFVASDTFTQLDEDDLLTDED